MAQKKTKQGTNAGTAVAVSAGVAALGVIGYLLMGPNGKKNRKNVKGWMLKMKGDVIEKLEEAKEVTAPMYEQIVEEIGAKYGALKHVDAALLAAEMATLKKSWKSLTSTKKKKKATKKSATPVTKTKTTKSAPKAKKTSKK